MEAEGIVRRVKGGSVLVLLMVFLFSSLAFAGRVGGGPYAFLSIGVGARALGMGGAFVALADDGTAAYWNPAGLSLLKKREFIAMYTTLSVAPHYTGEGVKCMHQYVGYAHPNILGGSVGVSWVRLCVEGVEKTGIDQYEELIREGKLKNSEDAFIFSYGRELFEGMFYLGVNLKYFVHQLYTYRGKGYGVDIGMLGDVSSIFGKKGRPLLGVLNNMRLGLIVRGNFEKVWNTGRREQDTISGELGLVFDPLVFDRGKWTVALALSQRKEQPMNMSVGTEIQLLKLPYIEMLALRAGVDDWYIESRYDKLSLEKLNYKRKVALGGGVRVGIFQIDYAAVFERFGIRHRISTLLSF
jgi:hypothetical protein